MIPLLSDAALATVITGIEAALKAAPGVVKIVTAAKDFISSLVGKLITKQQQQVIHDHIDKIANDLIAGNPPTYWEVEKDPTTDNTAAH
jgi:hypothetical protein